MSRNDGMWRIARAALVYNYRQGEPKERTQDIMDIMQIVVPVAILALFVASMLLTELWHGRAKGFGIVCLIGVFGLIIAEIALIAA